jgi:hypothetical protein
MDLAAKLQLKSGQNLESVLLPPSAGAALRGSGMADVDEHAAALLIFVPDRAP